MLTQRANCDDNRTNTNCGSIRRGSDVIETMASTKIDANSLSDFVIQYYYPHFSAEDTEV